MSAVFCFVLFFFSLCHEASTSEASAGFFKNIFMCYEASTSKASVFFFFSARAKRVLFFPPCFVLFCFICVITSEASVFFFFFQHEWSECCFFFFCLHKEFSLGVTTEAEGFLWGQREKIQWGRYFKKSFIFRSPVKMGESTGLSERLKYMYIPLLLKMINGVSWPAKIMATPFKFSPLVLSCSQNFISSKFLQKTV